MTTKIHPRQIRADLNTHVRREYKQEVVDEYANLLKQGREPPPLLVFLDPKNDETFLSDGFYRFFAHMKIRPNDWIVVDMKMGSRHAACWAALGRTTSKDSDIPTNRADRRWFTEQALKHPFGRKLSNRALGNYLGVDHKTVASVRMELIGIGEIPHVEIRATIDGYRNSGKKQKSFEPIPANEKAPFGREVFLPFGYAQLFSNQLLENFPDDYLEECVKVISYKIKERKLVIEKKKPTP